MRPDPYFGSYDASNPQSMNRYVYAMNNPLSNIDPSGLMLCQDEDGNAYDSGAGGCGDGGSPIEDSTTVTVDGDSSGPPVFVETVYTGSFTIGYLTPNADSGLAPNNVLTKLLNYESKVVSCNLSTAKKNGIALGLDYAGVGAGFLPAGELAVAGVQMGIGVASTVNSSIGGDVPGAVTSIFDFQLSAMEPAAKLTGVGARAVPFLGAVVSAAGFLNDALNGYKDYQSCMAGH